MAFLRDTFAQNCFFLNEQLNASAAPADMSSKELETVLYIRSEMQKTMKTSIPVCLTTNQRALATVETVPVVA